MGLGEFVHSLGIFVHIWKILSIEFVHSIDLFDVKCNGRYYILHYRNLDFVSQVYKKDLIVAQGVISALVIHKEKRKINIVLTLFEVPPNPVYVAQIIMWSDCSMLRETKVLLGLMHFKWKDFKLNFIKIWEC